jgi:hypothetical protein
MAVARACAALTLSLPLARHAAAQPRPPTLSPLASRIDPLD